MAKPTHESDIAFIKALAEIVSDNGLTALKVNRTYGQDTALSVRLSRETTHAPVVVAPALQTPATDSAGVHASGAAVSAAVSPDPATAPDPAQDPGTVPSPMVGTVYLAPEPGGQPFIKIGDPIEKDQTLMIIEAMKTMNQVQAPRSGKIRRILVEDGAPVEYGTPLVMLD